MPGEQLDSARGGGHGKALLSPRKWHRERRRQRWKTARRAGPFSSREGAQCRARLRFSPPHDALPRGGLRPLSLWEGATAMSLWTHGASSASSGCWTMLSSSRGGAGHRTTYRPSFRGRGQMAGASTGGCRLERSGPVRYSKRIGCVVSKPCASRYAGPDFAF